MKYYLVFYPYQRPFIHPLNTYHGEWKVRKGIIIHLTDEKGQKGLGEIAPLPWFGSETLAEALTFCHSLKTTVTLAKILNIPCHLPACQFGFESALESLLNPIIVDHSRINHSYLLPAGKKALTQWQKIEKSHHSQQKLTLKWKIGLESLKQELSNFEELISILPCYVRVRLDANGGLTIDEAKEWLKQLDQETRIEFLEQPLAPSEFNTMLSLAQDYKTPIALDESVSNLQQIEDCYLKGWRGIFIIKAAIAGYPSRLRLLLQNYLLDTVFSTVFETEIGQSFVIKLAQELSQRERALGFGNNIQLGEIQPLSPRED